MTTFEAWTVRDLALAERETAIRMARQAGVEGAYVVNSMLAAHPDDRALAIYGPDGEIGGLAWFGRRGNLILLGCPGVAPEALLPAATGGARDWRVALGPEPLVAAMAAMESDPPLVDRQQIYYAMPRGVEPRVARWSPRLALRADARALVRASLELSASDLNVPPWRVHKGWLRDSVRERIRERQTWVIGPPGAPMTKLDIGSQGDGGVVLEGVFTHREARGRGLATALTAGVSSELRAGGVELIGLHVAADNQPARRAYEAAGMVPVGSCRLLLRS